MKIRVVVVLIFLSGLLFAQPFHLFKPSFNAGSGCGFSGCHTLKEGILEVKLLDSVIVQIFLKGVSSSGKVAGELVDTNNVVVAVNNGTSANPFLLKAPKSGIYRVNAGYRSPKRLWDSAMVKISANISSRPDSGWNSKLLVTEIMFDVPRDIAGDANGDGIRGSHSDEFVEFFNSDVQPIDISGFEILDKNLATVFEFPQNSILQPKQFAVVFGAVGTKGFGSNIPAGTLLFAVHENDDNNDGFSEGSHSNFKNSGDNLIVVNPAKGDTLAEIYWGDALPLTSKPVYLGYPNTITGASISGAIRQSVTRRIGSYLWDKHTVVSNSDKSYFSPGWDVIKPTKVKRESPEKINFVLFQNYPNPFNPTTKINFSIPEMKNNFANVKLILFDALGRETLELLKGLMPAGNYSVLLNGAKLAGGVYFYSLNVNGKVKVKKLILLK